MPIPNPYRVVGKAGVPNFDPIFSSGYPSFFFDKNPFTAMRNAPGANHPWVYAAVSTIIRNYIQCPLRIYDIADPETLIEDHPVLDLMRRPNPSMSGTNFLESICWQINLPTKMTPGGQSFIWGDKGTNFRRGDIPDELWTDCDAGARPYLNKQKILQAWLLEYHETAPYDYGKMTLLLDEVIRVNYFNPYAINRGLSPGFPVRVGIGQDASADEYNTTFFANNAGMPGFISSKIPMGKAQLDEAKANWDKYFTGARNAGKVGLVPYEAEYHDLNLSPADANYLESKGWNRDQVLAAYQVSKFAVQQYEDINYATAKEAKRQLFDNAIIPMNALIMEELNEAWIEHIDKGQYRLKVDFDGVQALRDDRELNWKCAEVAVMLGIPPLIALKMNNIPVDDLDEKQMPWLLENQGPNAPFQGDADSKETKPPKEEKPKPKSLTRVTKVMTREEKDAANEEYVSKVLTPGEVPTMKAVRRFFVTERNRTLDLVDEWETANRSVSTATPSMFVLDHTREDMLLRGLMVSHYQSQAARAMKAIMPKIEDVQKTVKDLGQESTEREVRHWIENRLKFLSEVNDTTFKGLEDELSAAIAKSIADEVSTAQAAKNIREAVQHVYTGRINMSKTIARTEMGSVTCFVTHQAMKNAGIEKKAWLASKDELGYDSNVRPTHKHADEQGPIALDEAFDNGLMYPMQSGAPAKEVVNCRCNEIPVADDDPFA